MKTFNKLRLKALFIDIIFIFTIWIFIFIIYIYLFKEGSKYDYKFGLSLIISLFLCKDNFNGQSFGKRICNLKVVDYKRENIAIVKLIARNLFVFLAPIEFILLLYYDKRIGDNVIRSQVILVKKSDRITIMNILVFILTIFFTNIIFLPFV